MPDYTGKGRTLRRPLASQNGFRWLTMHSQAVDQAVVVVVAELQFLSEELAKHLEVLD